MAPPLRAGPVSLTVLADQFGETTLPTLIILGCWLVITVTVAVRWANGRRRNRRAGPAELSQWQDQGARLVNQWLTGVDAELAALRSSPSPELVAHPEDPFGLDTAIDECPDGFLEGVLVDLRKAANHLLDTARHADPSGPTVVAAHQAYLDLRGMANAALEQARAATQPQ